MCAKSFGEFPGIFDNLCGAIRHGVHADDGILQIDENKCGLLGVELEFCHGFLFIEDIVKSRTASTSLDL
jgi:hypothetical protein